MTQNFSKKELIDEAHALLMSVKGLSESLPEKNVRTIRHNLTNCLNDLPTQIETGLKKEKKIDKIKSFVTANSYLNECQDYLDILSHLQYYKPDDMIDRIEHIREEINSPEIIRNIEIN
ncbi:MAG: hypothetical protein B7C24_17515 [Bacteroidetes bacterium 4572_77]|nr:MAG: hypothetical protein B7C24_17515 [Bacteroidetes bacterium 4572_77]